MPTLLLIFSPKLEHDLDLSLKIDESISGKPLDEVSPVGNQTRCLLSFPVLFFPAQLCFDKSQLLYYNITVDKILQSLTINPQRGLTLAHQLKQQLSWLMISGEIKPDEKLPSVRQLADHLKINLHTVRNAYALLESDGLVETRQGWGTKALKPDTQQIANSINQSRSHTIGVIVPSLTNPVYHDLLRGIQEIADHDQSMIFVCNTQEQHAEAYRYLNQLLSKEVDGVIVASENIEQYIPEELDLTSRKPLGVPYISVDRPHSRGYSVKMDLENVGYQATNHLLQHGHDRIGLITYGFEKMMSREEDKGYQRALREAGIGVDPALVIPVPGFEYTDGEEGVKKLLRLPQPPSAIFVLCDSMAIGAMQTIKNAGLRIPEDISLIGFNDIPAAALLSPPLTTFSMPSYSLGKEAMKMLSNLIKGEQPRQSQVILPTPIVIRQSCGCTSE